jgi:Cu+-exporting ATPase
MASVSNKDHLAVIRIGGMHCHRCEQTIQKAIRRLNGVHEVEVDFPSAQASVLYDPSSVSMADLMQAISQAGYRATGFTNSDQESPAN